MKQEEKEIKILYLEDNLDDVELLEITLKRSPLKFTLHHVETESEFKAVDFDNFDIVVSDYNLQSYDGLSAIKFINSKFDALPIILLSGTVGEELAVDLLKAGANDFVLKANIKKMPLAIERAVQEARITLEKKQFQKELVEKNLILDTIFNSFEDIVFLKNTKGEYLRVNQAFCDLLKISQSEIIGAKAREIFPEEVSKIALENDDYVKLSGKAVSYDTEYIHDGKRKIFEVKKTPLINDGRITGIVGQMSDVTSMKLLLENTVKSKSILSQAERLTNSGSFEYDMEMDLIICSSNFKNLMQLRIEGDTLSFRRLAQLVKKEDRDIFLDGVTMAIENRTEYSMEHRFDLKDKDSTKIKHFSILLRPDYKQEKGNMFYGTVVDVTAEHETHVSIINKQEEGQKEIARELHDNLGQKMNAISMYVSKMSDDQPENKDLIKVKNLTHEMIDDLGSLISNISVKQVEEHSLKYAIDKLISYLPEAIIIDYQYDVDENKLSRFIKAQLFRVIQEALNNIMKYSKASNIGVKLELNGSIINLDITDDGVGFDVAEKLDGNGLQNIAYRVKKSNGLVSIDSKKGEGTRVTIKMPVG